MLKIQARKLGNVAILCLQGQIVNGETEILRNVVQSQSEVSAIKLDLAQVTTVDAGGLGAMLALRELVLSKGMRLELMNINKRVRMVLELTRLDSVFEVTPRVEFFPAVSQRRPTSGMGLASCA